MLAPSATEAPTGYPVITALCRSPHGRGARVILGRLSGHIRKPFWAFSNVVAAARIEKGRLISNTTGGTSMSCVLEHLARTRPSAAVVVTDGYIEQLSPGAVAAAVARTRLHVIVTRDGNPALIARARLPFTQLSKVPS